MVAAAASTGIAAIDVPYFKADDAGLKSEATASRRLGMTGKAALHADQLLAINSVFTPPPNAVSRMLARSWTPPAQAATTRLRSNGHVIEPAMLREAERVLAIAAELERAAVERGG